MPSRYAMRFHHCLAILLSRLSTPAPDGVHIYHPRLHGRSLSVGPLSERAASAGVKGNTPVPDPTEKWPKVRRDRPGRDRTAKTPLRGCDHGTSSGPVWETSRGARRTLDDMNGASRKRLNEMDDLRDMGHFPLPVHAGATANVLFTVFLTYLLRGRMEGPLVLPAWSGGVICANVLPVVLLRSRMEECTRYPEIAEMSFFADQHKFASWVYAVASANMLVWIVLSWSLFSHRRDRGTLGVMLIVAFACTFFPAWRRLFRR